MLALPREQGMMILFHTITSNLQGTHSPSQSNILSPKQGKHERLRLLRDAERLKKWTDKNFMKLRRKCKILHSERKKKSSKTSGRPDGIEKTWAKNLPSISQTSWPCLSIPYLPCLYYSTAVLQCFQTQNSKHLVRILPSEIFTEHYSLSSGFKCKDKCIWGQILLIQWYSHKFEIPHFDSGENLPLSCFFSSDTVEETSASIKKKNKNNS